MAIQYIDIHTHKVSRFKNNFSIFNHRLKRFKQFIYPKSPFSFGIHPWDIKEASDINILDNIKNDSELYAIGECGFDKNINIPFSVQTDIFIKHIEMSEQFQIPLIIHSVGYFNEIMDFIKEHQPTQKWIIHGFMGHPRLANQLVEAGLILSFGKTIFDKDSKSKDSLISTPNDAFFLETDENTKIIDDIYLRAAEIKKMTVEEMQKVIFENFRRVFKSEKFNQN